MFNTYFVYLFAIFYVWVLVVYFFRDLISYIQYISLRCATDVIHGAV